MTRAQRNHGQHARQLFQHEALVHRVAMVAVVQQRILRFIVGIHALYALLLLLLLLLPLLLLLLMLFTGFSGRVQKALCNRGVDFRRAPTQQFQCGIEADRNKHHHGQPNVVIRHKRDVSDVHGNACNVQPAAGPFGHARQKDDALLVIGNVEPHGLATGLVQLRAQSVMVNIHERRTGVNRAHQGRRIHAR